MHKFSAEYIYTISSEPLKNGIVITNESGVILDVLKEHELDDRSDVQKFEGIICPGFVNTHCHLELSHLNGKIKEKTGIVGFVTELLDKRGESKDEEIQQAIIEAENEMIGNGIVAVGDICNTNSTFKTKQKNRLKYYNFIEVLGLNPAFSEQILAKSMELKTELKHFDQNSLISVVPHAPYSTSAKLIKILTEEARANAGILSIHMQESEAENEFFIQKTGKILDLYEHLGLNIDFFQKTGKTSLLSIIENINPEVRTLFVHNTFTSEEDFQTLKFNPESFRDQTNSTFKIQNSKFYFCFCPNANLYIENTLPDIELFIKANAKITIGTDSLASNHQLSILEELKTISNQFPNIKLQTLLTWAAKNGAEFLGFDDELGTIEKGKRPGLVWVKGVEGLKLNLGSKGEKVI